MQLHQQSRHFRVRLMAFDAMVRSKLRTRIGGEIPSIALKHLDPIQSPDIFFYLLLLGFGKGLGLKVVAGVVRGQFAICE